MRGQWFEGEEKPVGKQSAEAVFLVEDFVLQLELVGVYDGKRAGHVQDEVIGVRESIGNRNAVE